MGYWWAILREKAFGKLSQRESIRRWCQVIIGWLWAGMQKSTLVVRLRKSIWTSICYFRISTSSLRVREQEADLTNSFPSLTVSNFRAVWLFLRALLTSVDLVKSNKHPFPACSLPTDTFHLPNIKESIDLEFTHCRPSKFSLNTLGASGSVLGLAPSEHLRSVLL